MNVLKLITIREIYQTEIDDKWATKLCMWLCEMWMAWSVLCFIAEREGKEKPAPFTLEQLNKLNDLCIEKGGLARLTDGDSDNGFVKNHEINAECVGLKGYKKIYEPIGDGSKVVNLVQWGIICELRDDGRHSMMAVGSYEDAGEMFLTVFDPWKKTDDRRYRCSTGMTQRKVNGKWVDSRSVESFAWYYKVGSAPRWVA